MLSKKSLWFFAETLVPCLRAKAGLSKNYQIVSDFYLKMVIFSRHEVAI